MTLAEIVRDAVVAHYMETGEGITVKDIAERLGWSDAKVRRVFADGRGSVDGVVPRETVRESYSRSYGNISGAHRITIYWPTLSELRRRLIEATGEG